MNKVKSYKNIDFNTQRRNPAVTDFEVDLYKILIKAFYGKRSENVRDTLKTKFFRTANVKKLIEQQSKLNFNGTHKSFTSYDSYTYKQNEIVMDTPIYLGFVVLDSNKLLMYETYYD